MKKKMARVSLAVMCVLFAAGLFLIFLSPAMGLEAGYTAVQRHGGMDIDQFQSLVAGSMHAYRTGGLIIALVGGMGLLASGCEVYRTINWYE